MIKNLPCNAEDTGSSLGQGAKVPDPTEQLSLCSTTRESVPQLRPNTAKSINQLIKIKQTKKTKFSQWP